MTRHGVKVYFPIYLVIRSGTSEPKITRPGHRQLPGEREGAFDHVAELAHVAGPTLLGARRRALTGNTRRL
jgi:hypothetical protein